MEFEPRATDVITSLSQLHVGAKLRATEEHASALCDLWDRDGERRGGAEKRKRATYEGIDPHGAFARVTLSLHPETGKQSPLVYVASGIGCSN